MHFGHKQLETGPKCSYELSIFFKYHMPLNWNSSYWGCLFQWTNGGKRILIGWILFPYYPILDVGPVCPDLKRERYAHNANNSTYVRMVARAA